MSDLGDSGGERPKGRIWRPGAEDLVDALYEHYLDAVDLESGIEEWSIVTQIPSAGSSYHPPFPKRPGAGASEEEEARYRLAYDEYRLKSPIRTIDVLLVRNWKSGGTAYERIAVEAKVERSDFFAETPEKRGPWEAMSHRFCYLTPAGLVKPEEVPEGCWLVEVSETACTHRDGRAHTRHAPTRVHWNPSVRGAKRKPGPLPPEVVLAVTRRLSRAEGRLRFGEGDAGGKAIEELAKLKKIVAKMRERENRRSNRVASLAEAVAGFGPQVCADCEKPIRLSVSLDNYGGPRWVHVKTQDDAACVERSKVWHRGVIPKSVYEVARAEKADHEEFDELVAQAAAL